jgi:SAM-dependent methyltransferase
VALTTDERWLAVVWPLVRAHVPPPPARVLEIGCGSLGGFVPALRAEGFDAIGIDPRAPGGAHYQQTAFEQAELAEPVEAVVASTSLHHVADPEEIAERIASALVGGGTLIVIEWAWEDFDEKTARWGFARLAANGADGGWLVRHRGRWLASGETWEGYLRGWANAEGLHSAGALLDVLHGRFDQVLLHRGPYLFVDLPGTSEAEEQAAIDRGEVSATRIDYVGRQPLAP